MIRQVKIAKDIAVKKVRTAAMISLKQDIIVNTPPELREELQPLTKMTLIAKCARFSPGQVTTITASTKWLSPVDAHSEGIQRLPRLVGVWSYGTSAAAGSIRGGDPAGGDVQ